MAQDSFGLDDPGLSASLYQSGATRNVNSSYGHQILDQTTHLVKKFKDQRKIVADRNICVSVTEHIKGGYPKRDFLTANNIHGFYNSSQLGILLARIHSIPPTTPSFSKFDCVFMVTLDDQDRFKLAEVFNIETEFGDIDDFQLQKLCDFYGMYCTIYSDIVTDLQIKGNVTGGKHIIRKYQHRYIHTYVHAYIHTYIHIHTYMHIYIYAYIHVHTYTCIKNCAIFMACTIYHIL